MSALIIVGIIILILVLMYNSLIAKKNQVENIFGGIDAQLKKRYDLIPNLVASVQQYMQHERTLLEKVTQMRTQALNPHLGDEKKMALDHQISRMLGSILVAVEHYPELKANENVMHLQQTLHEVEEQIAAARRAYNQAVTDYNNAIEMVPTNFMAQWMHYERKPLFKISETQREAVDVKALFDR